MSRFVIPYVLRPSWMERVYRYLTADSIKELNAQLEETEGAELPQSFQSSPRLIAAENLELVPLRPLPKEWQPPMEIVLPPPPLVRLLWDIDAEECVTLHFCVMMQNVETPAGIVTGINGIPIPNPCAHKRGEAFHPPPESFIQVYPEGEWQPEEGFEPPPDLCYPPWHYRKFHPWTEPEGMNPYDIPDDDWVHPFLRRKQCSNQTNPSTENNTISEQRQRNPRDGRERIQHDGNRDRNTSPHYTTQRTRTENDCDRSAREGERYELDVPFNSGWFDDSVPEPRDVDESAYETKSDRGREVNKRSRETGNRRFEGETPRRQKSAVIWNDVGERDRDDTDLRRHRDRYTDRNEQRRPLRGSLRGDTRGPRNRGRARFHQQNRRGHEYRDDERYQRREPRGRRFEQDGGRHPRRHLPRRGYSNRNDFQRQDFYRDSVESPEHDRDRFERRQFTLDSDQRQNYDRDAHEYRNSDNQVSREESRRMDYEEVPGWFQPEQRTEDHPPVKIYPHRKQWSHFMQQERIHRRQDDFMEPDSNMRHQNRSYPRRNSPIRRGRNQYRGFNGQRPQNRNRADNLPTSHRSRHSPTRAIPHKRDVRPQSPSERHYSNWSDRH